MRVAVTAWAWRTPLGATIADAVARLCAGERAAITNPHASGYACTLAVPILGEPAMPRNARFLRRMGLYGMEVAREALAMDGGEAGERVGLFVGVGGLRAHWDDMMHALEHQRDDGAGAWSRGLRDVHPYWMLRHLSNNVHALASAELDLRGEGATFGGGTAGAQAIVAAARALHDGAIDRAVVVAYDSLLEPETLVELGARRAATQASLADLQPPYDPRSAGYVPGEAAAALVLSRTNDAPLAWIEAATTADGQPDQPDTSTIARAIMSIPRDQVAFVDGAARAWPELDAAEHRLLVELIGPAPITAITAAMGQLGAATSIVSAIALIRCLRDGVIPPIAGTMVLARAMEGRVALALSTSAPGLAAAIHVAVPQ